jgi:hypothetical protein
VANYRGIGLADMIDAIEMGRQPRCSLDFALHVLDIMTSLVRSADQKQTISLTTSCERPAPLSHAEALALFR